MQLNRVWSTGNLDEQMSADVRKNHGIQIS